MNRLQNREEMDMTYYRWMMTNYLNDDSPEGDLAHDMKHDIGFPKKAGRSGILTYLIRRNACAECIRTFDESWRDYTNSGYADKRKTDGGYGAGRRRRTKKGGTGR